MDWWDEYVRMNAVCQPVTFVIKGLDDKGIVKFFNKTFEKDALENILAEQIESENYEI